MKKNYFIAMLAFFGLSTIWSESNRLFAQDKQGDFKLGSGVVVDNIVPCGDDEFFIIYGKKPAKYGVVPIEYQKVEKSIMKFDKNLQPIWKTPITIKVPSGAGSNIIYSYTNPSDKKTTSYLYDVSVTSYFQGVTNVVGPVGAEEFIQVLPDGTAKPKKTGIPKKDLQSIAAVFTDVYGLNIITLNGDIKNPTSNMNWYLFSHDQLTMTKKNIILPLPPGVNKDNESDWWLNEVTPNGLYFSYISYKNKVKEPGSILSCNIIKVNGTEKPGNIITIDLNYDKYSMMPASYTQNLLLASMPPITSSTDWQHSSDFSVFLPRLKKYMSTNYADDSYIGVQVDETNNRVYTITIGNKEFKTDKDGYPELENSMIGRAFPIKSFEATVYDLTGKKINQSIIDYKLAPENSQDDYNYTGNNISLTLLQNFEGVVFKAINNGNGYIFSMNKDGKVEKQSKFELFSYKEMTGQRYKDLYPAFYRTMKDFENSPYIIGNSTSPEALFCNKIDKKVKPTVFYLSLKSGDIFAILDSKNDIVKFSYFNKK